MSVTDELVEVGSEERFVKQGWHVNRLAGGVVSCVRDGFARVVVSWVGGEQWLVAWEYGSGVGELAKEWRAELVSADEVAMELDMTLNAMWL